MADTLQELFEHELRDIYDAEHKLVRALDTMAKKTPDETISEGFRRHRATTKEQIKRIETVFEQIDKKPRRESCKGINGLLKEFSEFVSEEEPAEDVLNTFAIGAALKVEHYEIVAYESLLRLARATGLEEAIDPLQANLMEERNAASELDALADDLTASLPGQDAFPDEAMQETILLPESEEVTGRPQL